MITSHWLSHLKACDVNIVPPYAKTLNLLRSVGWAHLDHMESMEGKESPYYKVENMKLL